MQQQQQQKQRGFTCNKITVEKVSLSLSMQLISFSRCCICRLLLSYASITMQQLRVITTTTTTTRATVTRALDANITLKRVVAARDKNLARNTQILPRKGNVGNNVKR